MYDKNPTIPHLKIFVRKKTRQTKIRGDTEKQKLWAVKRTRKIGIDIGGKVYMDKKERGLWHYS